MSLCEVRVSYAGLGKRWSHGIAAIRAGHLLPLRTRPSAEHDCWIVRPRNRIAEAARTGGTDVTVAKHANRYLTIRTDRPSSPSRPGDSRLPC